MQIRAVMRRIDSVILFLFVSVIIRGDTTHADSRLDNL